MLYALHVSCMHEKGALSECPGLKDLLHLSPVASFKTCPYQMGILRSDTDNCPMQYQNSLLWLISVSYVMSGSIVFLPMGSHA